MPRTRVYPPAGGDYDFWETDFAQNAAASGPSGSSSDQPRSGGGNQFPSSSAAGPSSSAAGSASNQPRSSGGNQDEYSEVTPPTWVPRGSAAGQPRSGGGQEGMLTFPFSLPGRIRFPPGNLAI